MRFHRPLFLRALHHEAAPLNRQEIVRYYESTGMDYETWSRAFNMHFGYWRWGLSPFVREPMLEEMNRQVQAMLALTESDGHVFDLGCGLGASMRSLARRHPHLNVTGLTLVQWQVEKATTLNADFPHLEVRKADYTNLSYTEEADAAYALESCCYAPGESKADFLKNLYQLLKPGGRFAVADGFTKRRRRPKPLEAMLRYACEGWALDCFPCLEPFTETLRELGFVDVTVREISWQIAPTVLQAPWTVVTFLLRKMAQGEKLDAVRRGHLVACFLSLAIGLFRNHYGYFLISGRKAR